MTINMISYRKKSAYSVKTIYAGIEFTCTSKIILTSFSKLSFVYELNFFLLLTSAVLNLAQNSLPWTGDDVRPRIMQDAKECFFPIVNNGLKIKSDLAWLIMRLGNSYARQSSITKQGGKIFSILIDRSSLDRFLRHCWRPPFGIAV